MSRVQMVGIAPDSDQDAIDYYNRIKQLKDIAAVESESYNQSHIFTNNLPIGETPNEFITSEALERYAQLAYHDTGISFSATSSTYGV